MNAKETKQRNWNIAQLRAIVPRIARLIPDDVYKQMNYTKRDISLIADDIAQALNAVKKNNFVCEKCIDISGRKRTKNKCAFKCDICGEYNDNLYLFKPGDEDEESIIKQPCL